MVTWFVMIPTFWVVTLHNLSSGRFGAGVVPIAKRLTGWLPTFVIVSYLVVAVIAQLRLDVINHI